MSDTYISMLNFDETFILLRETKEHFWRRPNKNEIPLDLVAQGKVIYARDLQGVKIFLLHKHIHSYVPYTYYVNTNTMYI